MTATIATPDTVARAVSALILMRDPLVAHVAMCLLLGDAESIRTQIASRQERRPDGSRASDVIEGDANVRPAPSHGIESLTRREREVAYLVARGCSNREIATELHVSVRTVETHVAHVMTKLGVRRRAGVGAILMSTLG